MPRRRLQFNSLAQKFGIVAILIFVKDPRHSFIPGGGRYRATFSTQATVIHYLAPRPP